MEAPTRLGPSLPCLYQLYKVRHIRSAMRNQFNQDTRLDDLYSSSITNLTTKRKWSAAPEAQEYNPYPRYESEDYKRRFKGAYVPCVGPRGKRLNESVEDAVTGYIGSPECAFFFSLIWRMISAHVC